MRSTGSSVGIPALQGREDVKLVAFRQNARMLRLADYPQLNMLVWNRPAADTIGEEEALALYERNWLLIDQERLGQQERQLIERLVHDHGCGVLLV